MSVNNNRGRKRYNYRKPKGSQTSTISKASTSSTPRVNIPVVAGPYESWKLYFPQEEYLQTSETVMKIKSCEKYFEKNKFIIKKEDTDITSCIEIDVLGMLNDQEFIENWPLFSEDLINKPDHSLGCIAIALQQILRTNRRINVRIINHLPILSLINLKVIYYEKMVTIKGTVIKVGSVGLKCLSMAFECCSCHSKQIVIQTQGVYTMPTRCCSCENITKFIALASSNHTTTVDWQLLKIQEMQNQSISGTIPRSVEVELQDDLVGSVCPGDIAIVTGIVRAHEEAKGGGKKAARLLQLYIDAISIQSQSNLSHPTLAFTVRDYYAINEIHGCGNILRLLVHSLCPSIYGQEIVKAGLILGLMGGKKSDRCCRSNSHILLIGDPALGKSRLLQAVAQVAPRGVYVCGTSSSAGGLTVTLGRASGGDFALEAGALVLADRGVCCIDELDKMSSNHGILLEAMEQGTVSIAKGGIVCSLPAGATVIAAANPVEGHYNRGKTVVENLKMSAPLLSRFDLVYILLDQPNEKLDALLSEHVLAMHSDTATGAAGMKGTKSSQNVIPSSNKLNDSLTVQLGLSESLRLKPGEVVDSLPKVLLRKYIAYAQKYVHPKLTQAASNELKDFYLELRRLHKNENIPVTTRQLEACIRLTEARARVDLREEASVQDARDVIELMKYGLKDTFSDEYGTIQLSHSVLGSQMSIRSATKKFIDILNRQATHNGKDTFSRKELCQIHKLKGLGGSAYELIESLHTHGYLLLKSPGMYKLLTM